MRTLLANILETSSQAYPTQKAVAHQRLHHWLMGQRSILLKMRKLDLTNLRDAKDSYHLHNSKQNLEYVLARAGQVFYLIIVREYINYLTKQLEIYQ